MLPTQSGSLRFFRFAGIQVYVHWSWFIVAVLDHAPGAVLVSAAVVPLTQSGGAFIAGAIAAAVVTRTFGGFTPGLFAAVGAVALARWAGLV